MTLDTDRIVKNLVPDEPVLLTKVKSIGGMISVTYTGINSKKSSSRMIDRETFEKLEEISKEGAFNFKGSPNRFLLYAEAERIHSAYLFDPLFAVNCSIVDPLPHQVEAVYKYLLPQPKIRFLLADDTGAGKTIMTGLLLKELMMRGLVERILVITPGGLTKQWQEDEMGLKFNIPFKLVNRAVFQSEPTIFSQSNRLVTSIDFIRSDDVLNVAKESSWDIIVVDEAHKLSAYDYGRKKYVSKRYHALNTLAAKTEHLLLLTATPHRGRSDTFKNILKLLDEDVFASNNLVTARIKEIGEKGVNKFFIRRLKEDMKDWNGNPLFKQRHTKTILYRLTDEEKKLYDNVTAYLKEKRSEARETSNIHVNLALMVMQRRLTSSIYAIMRTLKNRYNALKGLLDQLAQNPGLLKQKQKFDMTLDSLDDFDELGDQERESLENILSDPKKFKLFTTAKSLPEIKEETQHVKLLTEMAEDLYNSSSEEKKFTRLRELLSAEGVLDKKEKLVIFTEHKDTLYYLEQRLRNNGYSIATIHGGKSVEDRREAQVSFATEAQILIATDAAGEGINLQFCRLLINWDIPWNPNRLEQRMGRIHRYGQKADVQVFNMVSADTLEGKVLERLLEKLDLIREQMGDDRVYDVISDIFEGVSLEDIIDATFNDKINDYNRSIDNQLTQENVQLKLKEKKEQLGSSRVDYTDAARLKEDSDEKRLQPIYIRLFFEKAFQSLGGKYTEVGNSIYRIDEYPQMVVQAMRDDYNISTGARKILFCFDKRVFLEFQHTPHTGKLYYINPGNPVFDSLVKVVRRTYKEDMLKGAVLVSPEERDDYYAFYVKSQITDQRSHIDGESIADQKLRMIQMKAGVFSGTSPAKFLDFHAPTEFAKSPAPGPPIDIDAVVEWSLEHITSPQLNDTQKRVTEDAEKRKLYLEEAFNNAIFDLNKEINELQGKLLSGNRKVLETIEKKQTRIRELEFKKSERMKKLEAMLHLHMKAPEVLGCAYVTALTNVEYKRHYGMSRDDNAAAVAMQTAMNYERDQGRTPEDVSMENAGYDIRSIDTNLVKRYIEVKGRNGDGGIMLSENEMNRLAQLGDCAWLYIVTHCGGNPRLHRFRDPANHLHFKKLSRGIQYYLPPEEWKGKAP
jgi:SNF2 family DNA or RNA helicase